MKSLLILSILLCGCGQREDNYSLFRLSDGSVVECKHSVVEPCGLHLYECKGGFEGVCLVDVE